jgi:glycine/D-amino acid oxidase-like deaminating enzyme
VAVVGAGYTGLTAARELARRGRAVLVLDRGRPGRAASGRNGGMVIPGLHDGLAASVRRPDSLERWDESVRAVEELEQTIGDLGIACSWQRTGHVELAGHPRHRAALRAAADARSERRERARFLEGDALAEEIGSAAFPGGLLVERSAALQPAALADGLVSAARTAGATVVCGVEVTEVLAASKSGGGGAKVLCTKLGEVRAGDVVLATGADTDLLSPFFARRVLSVGSYLVATEPLGNGVAQTLSPQGRTFFDTRHFLNYWRLSPDGGRLLFGGRTSFAPTSLQRSRDELYAAMVRVYPQLRGVRIERAWGGLVDLSRDRNPHVGQDPRTGAWCVGGFSGSGVALATHIGAALGRWMCGDGPGSAFADTDRKWKPLPWPARVPTLLPVGGWWYRGRDLLGR